MSTPNDLIEVHSGTLFEAERLRGALESEGIPAFLKDENLGTLAPWQASAGGAGAVKVTIVRRDLERAESILRAFSENP